MAGIILVGVPFLLGQVVGSCIDVALVRTGRSIWPFHGVCLGIGVITGFANAKLQTDGPPTEADFNRV
jgi:hypothetical protein